jgi:hypothetical protein
MKTLMAAKNSVERVAVRIIGDLFGCSITTNGTNAGQFQAGILPRSIAVPLASGRLARKQELDPLWHPCSCRGDRRRQQGPLS